jgi:multidrug efflux pump subunit AcrA (membrane-fusion protein)
VQIRRALLSSSVALYAALGGDSNAPTAFPFLPDLDHDAPSRQETFAGRCAGRDPRRRCGLCLAAPASQRPRRGLASGNGRIEATEVDVATKLGGRVDAILVNEGDFVSAGQPLARMQVLSLEAQRDEAQARQQQSVSAVASAEAQVAVRESDHQAALALAAQRERAGCGTASAGALGGAGQGGRLFAAGSGR